MQMFCRRCHHPHEIGWREPSVCPACKHPTTWMAFVPEESESHPWELTANDRRFLLRPLKIGDS